MRSLHQQNMDLIHHSTQADFAHHLMSDICGQHQLETTYRYALDFQYDGLRLPSKKMAIGCIQYGANVAINIAQLKSYSISLPLSGKQHLNIHGDYYHSDQDHGLIVSNCELQDLFIDRDCKKLQVVIPEHSLQLVLAELLERPITESIVFNPMMNLRSDPIVGAWWSNIKNFMLIKAQYTDFYGLEMFSGDYENFLIKTLLLSQENNFSEELKGLHNKKPNYIQKVQKFLMQHAHENITLEMILTVAGVSKTKLYRQFQECYGMTPIAFLKKYRLQQIYNILSEPKHTDTSISQLAYHWGFTHLSRFAQDYYHEFGEKPSDTKAKFQ